MATRTTSGALWEQPAIHADLRDVAHGIHEEFDNRLDPREVEECLAAVAARFDQAKIRAFVPLLVRRYARDALRSLAQDIPA